jgi:hypothetical protein
VHPFRSVAAHAAAGVARGHDRSTPSSTSSGLA